jgi:hypothetical protein
MRGNYGIRDHHQYVYPAEMYPTDDDGRLCPQIQDTNHLGNPDHDALNNDDNQDDTFQMLENNQIAYFEEMERARLLQDVQQINQFEERNRMRELEQLQEVNEMQQMDRFEQLHYRRQRLIKVKAASDSRRYMQKDFTSQLEFIDKPEFSKRALPKYYASTRTINMRRGADAKDDIHHRRSQSVGRIGGKEDDPRDSKKRSKSTCPSRRGTRRRARSDRHHSEEKPSSRARGRARSNNRSHRNIVSSTRQNKRVPDKRYSQHDDRENYESSSDESWNRLATPREVWAGLIEEDGWLNQATDAFKGTFNGIFQGKSEISSDDDTFTSSSDWESGSDEDRF